MPTYNFIKDVILEPGNTEFFQARFIMSLSEVFSESALAMLAETIVTVKIVGNETIEPLVDSVSDPGFENVLPVRVPQTGKVFMHSPDRIALLRNRISLPVLFQKLHGVFHRRFGTQ